MLEAANADLVFTISLKRSTQNLQLSTSRPADYPIFAGAIEAYAREHAGLTPAMAAGVTDKLWKIGDVVKMLETWEASQKISGLAAI